MKKCICLLWLLMDVCFCSPAGAETGLYFLSWDMDGDAVCYALEVTTEDGEVLYADDSVRMKSYFRRISPRRRKRKFSGVCGLSIYMAGLSMAGPKESLSRRSAVFWNGKRLFSVRIITRTGG